MITAGNPLLARRGGSRFVPRLAVFLLVVNSDFSPSEAGAQPAPADAPTPQTTLVLSNVQQVLNLGTYRARHVSQPVRLRGTLVQLSRKAEYLLVHDETGSILIMPTHTPAELTRDKIVEVEGWTE